MPTMNIEDENVNILFRFVNDTNFRIIDWVQSGGKLNDPYVLNMVKKSESLFNSCLSDNDIENFNRSLIPFELDELFRENIQLKQDLEYYKGILSEQ